MMSVSIASGAAKAGDQHVGAKSADGAHHVSDNNLMAVPFAQRLIHRLGEAEIGHVAEALLHAVIFVGLKKFQCAQDAKLVRTLSPELVLAAFTAGNGKQ